jgi:hypothetical protein
VNLNSGVKRLGSINRKRVARVRVNNAKLVLQVNIIRVRIIKLISPSFIYILINI